MLTMWRLTMVVARAAVAAIFLVAGAALGTAPAWALTACGARGPIIAALAEKYEEARRAYGIMGQAGLVELYVSKSGSWTVVVSSPNGRACIVGAGHSWETLPPPDPGKETALPVVRVHEMAQADGPPIVYPPACCSKKDCRPLANGDVEFTPAGWHIKSIDRTVPADEWRLSPDGRWHVCQQNGNPANAIVKAGGQWCVWRPEGGL